MDGPERRKLYRILRSDYSDKQYDEFLSTTHITRSASKQVFALTNFMFCDTVCHVSLQLMQVEMFIFSYLVLKYSNLVEHPCNVDFSVLAYNVFITFFLIVASGAWSQIKFVYFLKTGVYLAFCYAITPVTVRLTQDFATDTVHTCSFFMLLIHLLFMEYYNFKWNSFNPSTGRGFPSSKTQQTVIFTQNSCYSDTTISTNAAIFSGVALASRLQQHYQNDVHGEYSSTSDGENSPFVFLIITTLSFIANPSFLRFMRQEQQQSEIATSLLSIDNKRKTMQMVNCAMLFSLITFSHHFFHSLTISFVLITSFCFINITLPCLFTLWVNKYRDVKFGPWDEAVPLIL